MFPSLVWANVYGEAEEGWSTDGDEKHSWQELKGAFMHHIAHNAKSKFSYHI